ncbi:MAG: AAA family ATPase [Chloroflexi bacterium]|nr:AAA family ATPase [Chloroflexota bacterium]
MKIHRLEIFGFGRLHQAVFDLTPGLNIFVGHNEAGKSTLQQAMIALLYGFRQGRRTGAAERDWIERFRPWHSAAYGGALTYGLDSGSTYKVTRVAENSHFSTTVVETATGADVSNAFTRDHLGNVDFSLQHFGVPRDVFLNTFVVRHSDLGPLSDVSYDIADTIVSGTGKERRHRAIQQAQEAMQRAMRDYVGSERNPASPMAAADQHLQELLIEKKLIEMDYRNRTQDLAKYGRLKLSLDTWMRERDELKYFLSVLRMNALGYRLYELEKLAETEANLKAELVDLQVAANFPMGARDTILELSQELKTHAERLARAEGAAAPSRAQVEEMQAEAARLREAVRRLDSARFAPVEQEAAARELERALPEAIRAHQKSDEELKIVRQALTVLAQSRNGGPRRHVMSQITPERLREARARWEFLQQSVIESEAGAQAADAAWQVCGISEDEFNTLALKAGGLTPDNVADLKSQQMQSTRVDKRLRTRVLHIWKRFGTVFLIVLGFAGFGLFVASLANTGIRLIVEGALMMAAATLFGAGAWLLGSQLNLEKTKSAQMRAELQRQLAQSGFASLAEMEAAQSRYEALAPLHAARQAARERLDQAHGELSRLRAELHTLYNLPLENDLTAEHFNYLESEAEESNRDLGEQAQLERRREELEAEVAARRDGMQKAIEGARAILKAAGMVEINLLVDMRSLLALYDQRRELDRLEAQLQALEETLNGRLEATLSTEADVRAERTAVMGIEAELRLVLSNAGIEAAGIADSVQQFNDRYRQAERHTRGQSILQSLDRERAALLRADTTESLLTQQKQLAQTIQKLLDVYPHLANMRNDQTAEALETELADLLQKISQSRQTLGEIEARLKKGATEIRPLAEVVEEIERAQQRLERLSFEGRALQVGLEFLESAADDYYRNFLPRLNTNVARRLEAVTGGHYNAVEVDRGDLGIRVEAPELHRFIRPENFSQGVQDQIYLLLRLGLAEMIGDGRESMPFMLDDPFVNYDDERLAFTLDMLARLAEETQFMLFTKDEQIAHWARQRGVDADLHRVHELR